VGVKKEAKVSSIVSQINVGGIIQSLQSKRGKRVRALKLESFSGALNTESVCTPNSGRVSLNAEKNMDLGIMFTKKSKANF
jgi:hypothetical protein